ncbi:DUF3750 domain-containing protein [Pokkaliibacter sp. CJK22405]|uniref:DUF3750 domain-containing protein n=1 Tax=Pokkaliibacter sp. CJK22405 TaxID=3384615 RepID=UPI0039851F12
MRRLILYPLAVVVLLLLGPLYLLLSGQIDLHHSWQNSDRSSAQLAPDPATTPEAVVQVYGARAYNWRGAFAVHTWIATKDVDARDYVVHQVLGWRQPHMRIGTAQPDRAWFGSKPVLLGELRGPKAAEAIAHIFEAERRYPYNDVYRAWPGPNSNTFVAWVVREVPELTVALPGNALGKDYLGESRFVAPAPSDTGYQVSLWGVLGGTLAAHEGVELNLLGMVLGYNWYDHYLKLPGVGDIGRRSDAP